LGRNKFIRQLKQHYCNLYITFTVCIYFSFNSTFCDYFYFKLENYNGKPQNNTKTQLLKSSHIYSSFFFSWSVVCRPNTRKTVYTTNINTKETVAYIKIPNSNCLYLFEEIHDKTAFSSKRESL